MVRRKAPSFDKPFSELGKKQKHKEVKSARLGRMKDAKESGTVATIDQKMREKKGKERYKTSGYKKK